MTYTSELDNQVHQKLRLMETAEMKTLRRIAGKLCLIKSETTESDEYTNYIILMH